MQLGKVKGVQNVVDVEDIAVNEIVETSGEVVTPVVEEKTSVNA